MQSYFYLGVGFGKIYFLNIYNDSAYCTVGGQVDGIIIACNYGKSNDFGRHRSSVTTSVQRSILEK